MASSGALLSGSALHENRAPKRQSPDPRGPVLELLHSFGVRDRCGYYDSKVRGKVVRMDNVRSASAVTAACGKGTGKVGRRTGGYGGGRHRRVLNQQEAKATTAAENATATTSTEKLPCAASARKSSWDGLRYEDFEPLRELWVAYIDDIQPGSGPALAEALASCDLHGAIVGVVQARNPGCVRLRGTVIEETQQTFRIITKDNRVRMLIKEACVFELEARGECVRLLGPAWSHRLPGGVPGPHAPLRWTLSAVAARNPATRR
eukprot:TRINITY_DN48376_c0_g1_i1.p1 TRINITY_DN48376_c0_g1~~TRINITY_DN48376_c0_g1_i1.p1  ORF type:complete len:263 (+),score=29.58 TRINITY_DN48376_c0_g1_i1:176-964(+)